MRIASPPGTIPCMKTEITCRITCQIKEHTVIVTGCAAASYPSIVYGLDGHFQQTADAQIRRDLPTLLQCGVELEVVGNICKIV